VHRFQKLSARWFREYPWPEAEKISDIVEHDELFLHLYRELYCRHIYAMHKVGLLIVRMCVLGWTSWRSRELSCCGTFNCAHSSESEFHDDEPLE